MKKIKTIYRRFIIAFVAILISGASWLLASDEAYAIPSFARQTGMQCSACHTVFPELTPFGRQFKLRGYTLGAGFADKQFPYNLPLAARLQFGETSVKDRYKGANPAADFPQSNKPIVQLLGLYYGGKIAGKVGAFAQYNYDGIEKKWAAEMIDVRYADSLMAGNKELIYGVSVSNSPSMEDVWNTSGMWVFPYTSDAGIMPMQTSLLDMMPLANQVGNVGVYGFYDSQLYVEFGFMHNGKNGVFRPLNVGTPLATAISGNAPHLRLAWEKDWGDSNSFMIGGNALRANIYPDPTNLNGPTDRYTDAMVDTQFQHYDGDHLYSLLASYGHEKRDWTASFPAMNASNSSDNLDTFRVDGHYWYQRKIGGGIGYFDYRGSTDKMAYGMGGMGGMGAASAMGNANGSPDTSGWIGEVDWLPLENRENLKLGLRYTVYTKYNGASTNYNGAGRNASDNNSVYAYAWLMF
ncbi:MAG: hypothetical protein GC149_12520 [Gammaproteobacteria bacterium]|nr:hypothetical protein [Gammaproteobacteria bacterium]